MGHEVDEGAVLRALADRYPTLRELREAAPKGAERFLEHTKHQSGSWPIDALIEGYLDSVP
jgi:hypothetical protein